MRIKKYFLASALILIAIVLVSCASSPKNNEPKASLSILSQEDIKNGYLGSNPNENPYMEPLSLVRGRQTEFVIVRMNISIASEASVNFYANVRNENGENLAELKTKDEFFRFWQGWQGDPILNRQRELNIQQTYIPASDFSLKPGNYTYYAVLMAKYPIPRPAKIHAELNVSGISPAILDIPLADPSVGRPKGLF